MRLIDLTRGPSAAPLPAILVQGLPDYGRTELLDFVRRLFPHLKVAHVSAQDTDVEPTGRGPCHLVDSLLEAVATVPVRDFDRLWIDVPPLLDVSYLTAALGEEHSVVVHVVATCLDASRLLDDFTNDRTVAERCGDGVVAGLPVGTEAAEVSLLEPLSGFIESCDLIWLHGPDPEGRSRALVRRLNPGVAVSSDAEEVARAIMYPRRRFDPEKTYGAAAWKQAMRRIPTSSRECFRARRPFHPQRFDDRIAGWPESILRSFGSVWLAIPHDHAVVMDQFGPAGLFLRPDGRWLASVPAREQRDLLRAHPDLRASWDPVWADRMTELAFVADQPLTEDWSRALEACLLTDFEMRMDWSRFPNPFSDVWEEALAEIDDDDDDGPSEGVIESRPRLTLLPGCSGDCRDPGGRRPRSSPASTGKMSSRAFVEARVRAGIHQAATLRGKDAEKSDELSLPGIETRGLPSYTLGSKGSSHE